MPKEKNNKNANERIAETKSEQTINYTNILNKIFISLIVMIVLLGTNTILLLLSIGEFESTPTETTETEAEYDTSMFSEVDGSQYEELYKKDEIVVTYFGRATCGYCVKFLPVLQQAQKDYSYQTYYLDIDKLDEENADIILALNDQFSSTLGTTPMVTITKNGELLDMLVGYTDYESFASFLEKSGVTK